MQKITLTIKDDRKVGFLRELLKQFDFIEFSQENEKKDDSDYDFFNSAGMWSNRQVDVENLRKKAWKRSH